MGVEVMYAVPSLLGAAFVVTSFLLALPATTRGPMRRSFTAVAVTGFVYLLGDGMARLSAAGELAAAADNWNMIHAVGTTFLPPAILLFAATLADRQSAKWLEPTVVSVFGLAAAFVGARLLTPLIVVETRVAERQVAITPGEAYGVYVAFLFVVLVAALAVFLIWTRASAPVRTRREGMLGAAATAVMLGAGGMYELIATTSSTPPIDPVSLSVPVTVLLLFSILLRHQAPATSFTVIRASYDSLPDPVLIVGPSTAVALANEAAQRLLSAPSGKIEGALLSNALRAPAFSEAARARIAGAVEEVCSGGSDDASLDVVTVPPDERRFEVTVAAAVAPIKDGKEAPRPGRSRRSAVVRFQDITEKHAKEAQLSRANEAKDLFISMFGHDLKAPLSAISGYSELVALDSQHSSDALAVYKYSLQIRDAAAQIQLMMENARVFSRMLDAKAIESLQERIDIPAVLRREVSNIGRAAELKGVKVSLNIESPPADLWVRAAPIVRNVFLNLLDNAVKYTPAGSTVTVGARSYGEVVEVDVTDEGPGVPVERREDVFRKFTRLEQTRTKAEGIGIGLSIVRGIAEMHGGTVAVQDRPDGKPGAVFVVRLPRSRA